MTGYIVKLHQKFYEIDAQNQIMEEFNAWLSFDYMRVIPVEHFEDFYKQSISTEIEKISIRDLSCSRQKIYLCGNNEKDIFLQDDDPILSLSMIKFQNQCGKIQQEECLKSFLENQNIRYAIFDSLSHSDKIIVMRERSYEKIIDILIRLQYFRSEAIGRVQKIYTIGCLNCKKIENLSQEDKITIRVAVPLNQIEKTKISKADNVCCVMGKEDVEIEQTGSSREIIEFLISREIISENGESKVVKRISILKSKPDTLEFETVFGGTNGEKNDMAPLRTLMQKVEEAGYSSSIKNLMNRLIIRAWQIEKGNSLIIQNNNIWENVKIFIEVAIKYSDNIKHNDSVVEGIKSLSLLMDNMTSDNYDDFEIPQGNSRFTGTMSRLLQAYNNFLKDLSELTEQLRSESRKGDLHRLNYLTWAAIDTNEVVSAKQLFIEPESQDRLLLLNLSHEAMFHIREIMAWSIHEIGHYLRTGWQRRDRNKCLHENVQRVFLRLYESYLNRELTDEEIDELQRYQEQNTICNIDVCEYRIKCTQATCGNKHISDQIKVLGRYYDNLLKALFDGTILGDCGILRDKYVEMRLDMERYLEMLKTAYQEAQADMYMIAILNIKEAGQYIDIVRRYFEYSKMSTKEISLEVLIRVHAVIMVIDSERRQKPITDYQIEELEEVLDDIYNKTKGDLFVQSLKKNIYYAFAIKLAEFLCKIKESIESALEQEECKKIKERIYERYDELMGEDEEYISFENALNFIEKYSRM